MTRDELTKLLNERFALNQWPSQFKVDHETYANVVQAYFDIFDVPHESRPKTIYIALGPNNGIMHKHVELILDRTKK